MLKNLEIRRGAKNAPAVNDLWLNFRDEFDNLFDRFSGGFQTYALKPLSDLENYWSKNYRSFAPLAVDVGENTKAYTISAELPGVDEKNIEVCVEDGILVIKGEKLQEKEEKDKQHYMSERCYGAFRRMFALPKGTDESKVEARFQNGVLMISVPKPAGTPARKVDVKAA